MPQGKIKTALLITIVAVIIIVAFLVFNSLIGGVQNTNPNNISKNLFPFSGNENTPSVPTPVGNTSNENKKTVTPPITSGTVVLRQITSASIAGYTTYTNDVPIIPETTTPSPVTSTSNKGKNTPTAPTTKKLTIIRFIERESGNVSDVATDTWKTSRITNTTIPRIYSALFGNEGNSVILRFLKDDNYTISTWVGKITPPDPLDTSGAGNGSLTGGFIQDGITDITVSPDGKSMAYILSSSGGVSGITSSIDGTNKKQIFSSPFTEWILNWPGNKLITATTKATGTLPGFSYKVEDGQLIKILGGVSGLTALSNSDGSIVAGGLGELNNMSLGISSGGTNTITPVGVKTIPEKCAWQNKSILLCGVPASIPDGALLPDNWYQGVVSFADGLWSIDTRNNTTTLLINPTLLTRQNIDVENPTVDPSGRYFIFMNKTDGTLWSLDLSPEPKS